MSQTLRVLVVEDNAADVDLIRELLPTTGPARFELVSVMRLSEALARVRQEKFDLVLLDLGLPDSQGLDTFHRMRETAPELPIVLLTGNNDQDLAVTAVKAGAQDYLIKGQVVGNLLGRALVYAVERKQAEDNLRREQNLYRDLVNTQPAGIYRLRVSPAAEWNENNWQAQISSHYSVDLVSDRFSEITGISRQEFQANPQIVPERIHPEDLPGFVHQNTEAVVSLSPFGWEGRLMVSAGQTIWVRFESIPRLLGNGEVVWTGLVSDISERKRAEEDLHTHKIELEMQNEELRRAQVQLEASRSRYVDLYDLAPIGYLTLSDQGLIQESNLAAADLLGTDRNALVSQPLSRFILPTDQDIHYRHSRLLFSTGEQQACELRLKSPDGAPLWARLEAAVAKDPEGRLICRAMLSDITEHKQNEDVLAFLAQYSGAVADEEIFHTLAKYLAENLGMDFVCIDRLEGDGLTARTLAVWSDGKFEDNVTYALKDTPCGEVVGKAVCCFPASVCRLFPRDEVLQELQAESYIGVTLFNHAGKPIGLIALISRRPLANRARVEAMLKLVGVRAAGELERRWAEAELRESEERYRIITENMGDTVWMLDMNLQTVYISPSVVRVRGYTLEEIKALPLEKNFTPDTMKVVARVIAEELTPERLADKDLKIERTLELEFARKDGSFFWSEATITLVRDGDGKPAGIVGVGRDISERKRAEVEREKLESQLRQSQKMEAVGQLAGGVAHDFNNQLTVILTSAGMALKDVDPQSQLFEDLTDIYNAAQRSAGLTRQLLAFARKEIISPQLLVLNDVIGELLKMLGRLIGESIRLTWKPSSVPGLVRIDPSQLDQLLANLSVNARDAISGHGSLTIETDVVEFDAAYCEIYPNCVPGSYVMLAVSDDGCGMDRETMTRLFEPFFTTKERGKGTGLGLATVYGIVRQNNGIINVYSEPGKGTTFKIYLPQAQTSDMVAVTAREANLLMGDETILLVEDEEPILKIALKIMKQCGYQVLSTGSPRQAIELARQHTGPIHLLLTDVVMPEINGKELAQRIVAIRPEIKVLYMSGYTSDIIAHNGVIEEGAIFLQKPFSAETLAGKIRQAISGP